MCMVMVPGMRQLCHTFGLMAEGACLGIPVSSCVGHCEVMACGV